MSTATETGTRQCPEAIFLDGEHLLRCAEQGGHEGEHRTAPFDHGGHEGVTATWSVPADDPAEPPF